MERTLLFYNTKELKDLMSLRAPSAVLVRQPQSRFAEINGNSIIHSCTQTELSRKEEHF